MRALQRQTGISLTGLIVLLFVFVVIAFGVGWLANTYYANRLFLVSGLAPDFPSVLDELIKPLLQGKINANDIPFLPMLKACDPVTVLSKSGRF